MAPIEAYARDVARGNGLTDLTSHSIQDNWDPNALSYNTMVKTLTSLSLSFGAISVCSTLLAFYWFVKMKRSFRHDLIMLLIQSDLVKSIWFVIFPVVNFAVGPVHSSSVFCQVSGFFLTVGIESSDLAVLLIAIHSVMYILRPGSGLYPYRRIAYAAYVVLPSALAALAFVNGHGYENVGHYCYLRTDYSWARLALSWVPRYVLLVMIVIIYLFLYIYATRTMGTYDRRASGTFPQARDKESTKDVPPTPQIVYHGLISPTPNSWRLSRTDAAERHRSISSISTIQLDSVPLSEPLPVKAWAAARRLGAWHQSEPALGATSVVIVAAEAEEQDEGARNMVPDLHHLTVPPAARVTDTTQGLSELGPVRSASYPSFWQRPLALVHAVPLPDRADRSADTNSGTLSSQPNLSSMLRHGPTEADSDSISTTSIALSPSIFIGHTDAPHQRERLRRQFWTFFLYPLVYIIIWVFPFISHVLGYDDAITADDPQWLLMLSIISLCVQGTVDCLLFGIREAPWKHTRGGFWAGLRKRLTWTWRDMALPGRTREEMLVDGRIARARRKQEVADERTQGSQERRKSEGREWWDAEFAGSLVQSPLGESQGRKE